MGVEEGEERGQWRGEGEGVRGEGGGWGCRVAGGGERRWLGGGGGWGEWGEERGVGCFLCRWEGGIGVSLVAGVGRCAMRVCGSGGSAYA